MNFDDYGTDDESTFPRRHPENLESLDHNAKFGKVRLENPQLPIILNLLSRISRNLIMIIAL